MRISVVSGKADEVVYLSSKHQSALDLVPLVDPSIDEFGSLLGNGLSIAIDFWHHR